MKILRCQIFSAIHPGEFPSQVLALRDLRCTSNDTKECRWGRLHWPNLLRDKKVMSCSYKGNMKTEIPPKKKTSAPSEPGLVTALVSGPTLSDCSEVASFQGFSRSAGKRL